MEQEKKNKFQMGFEYFPFKFDLFYIQNGIVQKRYERGILITTLCPPHYSKSLIDTILPFTHLDSSRKKTHWMRWLFLRVKLKQRKYETDWEKKDEKM